MYEHNAEYPPRPWTVTEQIDSRIEYKRLTEYGPETKPIRISGKRTCPGRLVDPIWVLRLKTGMEEFSTTDRFDTAGCHEDANKKLWEAMKTINRVVDRSADGYVGHKRIADALNSGSSVHLK